MQTVVERLMKTYGMTVNLTVAQEEEARGAVGSSSWRSKVCNFYGVTGASNAGR
jgi:hypothetical protein